MSEILIRDIILTFLNEHVAKKTDHLPNHYYYNNINIDEMYNKVHKHIHEDILGDRCLFADNSEKRVEAFKKFWKGITDEELLFIHKNIGLHFDSCQGSFEIQQNVAAYILKNTKNCYNDLIKPC